MKKNEIFYFDELTPVSFRSLETDPPPFDFDPNVLMDGHFRLAALQSLIKAQDNSDKVSSVGKSLGKFGHGRKSPSMASPDAPQKTNSK